MDMNNIIDELKNFMDENKKLKQFPKKRKLQVLSLFYLASKFELGKKYTEKEIDKIINNWHLFNDWAMLRRLLYQGGFLDRHIDGSLYWVKESQPKYEEFQKWISGAVC